MTYKENCIACGEYASKIYNDYNNKSTSNKMCKLTSSYYNKIEFSFFFESNRVIIIEVEDVTSKGWDRLLNKI
jgi:ribosomal protein S17E